MAAATQKATVVCLGDSHTQGGMYGADYVKLLAAQRPALRFVNAGMNGQVSQQIAARLPPLLQQHRPAAVLILAGSNDAIALQSPQMQGMYNNQAAKAGAQLAPCSREAYLANMAAMLRQVQAAGSQAVVVTLPPITEEPDSPANATVDDFNQQLKQLVGSSEFAGGSKPVVLADFHGACLQHLRQHSPAYQQQQQATARGKQGFRFTVLGAAWWMLSGRFMHHFLGMPWNSISRRRRLALLTDQIHLNEEGARLLVGVLEPVLKQVEAQKE